MVSFSSLDPLNFFTAIALGALGVDVYLQLRRVMRTGSSDDVSIKGVWIRYAAAIIILVKFVWIQDTVLIGGQIVIVALISYYLLILACLARPKKKLKKR